jgi:hypothetical protein
MEKNKTGKYFKYAIGEIILVVIGILIALQINNWNEKRKMDAEENILLKNLSISFKSKLVELENKNIGRKQNIESIGKLLEVISSEDKHISDSDMYNYRSDLFIWYAVNEEFSILDMLYNSGKINTISNDSLKSALIEWPDKMEEMLEEQRVLQNLVTQELNPLIRKYSSTLNFLSSRRQEINIDSPSPFPNNFKALLNDRQFESLITEKLIYLDTNIADTEILIIDAKEILKLIEEELKK